MDLERRARPNQPSKAHAVPHCCTRRRMARFYPSFNLIDTPGHVDFLPTKSPAPWPPAKAALLVVDASQGVEAQTLRELISRDSITASKLFP